MRQRRGEAGLTMIEMIISLTVLIIFILAVFNLLAFDLRSVSLGNARSLGLALANERMEYLRDLPYNSLATQNGTIYPAGTIPDNQTFVRGNYTFRVHTIIQYVDDPYDGNAEGTITGKPTDLYPYDYKLAEVTVYLVSNGQQVAQLDTYVSAKAAETASNTGIITVTVDNASGQPVPNATVAITNPDFSPAVNIQTTTDNNGEVVVPKLPPSSNNDYQVIATASGDSTDGTLPNSGSKKAVKLNLNVLAQQITPVTLAIDQLGQINVTVDNTSGGPISNLAVTTIGSKLIYTNPNTPKYTSTTTTSSSGTFTLSNMEFDGYTFTLPNGYYLVATSPYAPTDLSPGATLNVTLTVSTSSAWPVITSVSPPGDNTGSPTTLTITGSNFTNGTTFKIQQAGQADITASGVTASGISLTGTLDLTSAATGSWNLVVTNSVGTTIETGGFNVLSN